MGSSAVIEDVPCAHVRIAHHEARVHNGKSLVITEVPTVGLSVVQLDRTSFYRVSPPVQGTQTAEMMSRVLTSSSLLLPQEDCNLFLWSKRTAACNVLATNSTSVERILPRRPGHCIVPLIDWRWVCWPT